MLEKYFEKRFVLDRFRASPAGPQLDGFATWLAAQGYSLQTGGSCLRHAVHLGRWLDATRVEIATLDEKVIAAFVAHFPACDCEGERVGGHDRARARVRVFRRYLQAAGVVPRAPAPLVEEPLLGEFVTWMRQQCGVTEWTVKAYSRVVRKLLERVGREPGAYTIAMLRRAVLALAEGHGASKGEQVVTATRMFLRQLAVRGVCSPDLADGIPRPARWSQTTLPKHLPPEDVEKLIASCDVSSATGLRDRAIMLLLARLGVRAGDVLALRLADIDWRRASFRVVGKGRRESWLPLPQDIGDAILAYLERGRPRIDDDHVFLTVRAPWRDITNNSSIAQLVERAIQRAGVHAPSFGSHLLRHSAATAMLREGASLDGIASILRHRSIQTTTVYARVDQRLLGQVAQPWMTSEEKPMATMEPPTPTADVQAIAQPWLVEVPSC
jgi:site-specific recombinase XerD